LEGRDGNCRIKGGNLADSSGELFSRKQKMHRLQSHGANRGKSNGMPSARQKDTKFLADRPIGAYGSAAMPGIDKAALKNPPPVLYCIAEEPFCQTKG